jgi:hypothetical protein
LSREERDKFTQLVQTEEVLSILPNFTPWWRYVALG